MKKIVTCLFLLSVFLWGVSFFHKGKLPRQENILPTLYQEPRQTEIEAPSFTTERKGIVYTIRPRYAYELYGLVVSCHDSDAWYDYYHNDWKDYINAKDICVVWGDNLKTGIYQLVKYSSGSWTCYIKAKREAPRNLWVQFRQDQLSNNHLLAHDEAVNSAIRSTGNGDQVYLKGFLVEYSHSNGAFRRGTSISREDRGNNACETVYVTDYEVLRKANPVWRFISTGSWYGAIFSLILLIVLQFVLPYKHL